jgi:hypothetical protein
MKITFGLKSLMVFLCILVLVPVLHAQSGRGTITGTVTDNTGGVIPGVEVTATNIDTGVETRTVTTDVGLYRIPYIQPGRYRVAASMSGFKTTVQDNVQVLTTQTVTANFALEVGDLQDQITVSSSAALLEKDTSEIGTAATELEVHTWPIMVGDGTRQLQNFIFTSMPGTQGDTWNGSINGGQSFAHEILIDGISIGRMDLNGGSNNEFTPTVDAVSEFKLQTGATSAQYGNSQTGLTNFAMKSGTNEYHGTAFWFHQNEYLNANSWANNANPVNPGKRQSRLHNFGTTFGGPVFKDKTFFFFSYEGNRQTSYNLSGGYEALPVAPFKQGDFSLLLDPSFTLDPLSGTTVGTDAIGRPVVYGQIYDPATSRQLADGSWIRDPFPGNIIPANRMNPISQRILSFGLPEPERFQLRQNNPTVSGCCPVLNIDNYSFKLDHVFNEAHKTTGSFVYNDRYRLRYGYGGPGYQWPEPRIPATPLSGDKTQSTPGWIIRFAEDWTIGPTKLNHFALGYNRFRNQNVSNSYLDGRNWAAELGLQNVGGSSFPQLNFGGFNNSLSGQYQIMGHQGTNNAPNGSIIVSDDFTWIRGAHSFRFGGEHRRYYINDQNVDTPGSYTFHNENTALPGTYRTPTGDLASAPTATGFAFSSFLLGQVRNAGVGVNRLTSGIRSRTTAVYFQDDWKVRPSLTLNLGLRWDIPQPFTEAANRMSALDPNRPNPAADGYPGALTFLGNCPECNGRNAFGEVYWRQFGPRLGVAWATTQKLVVRGGYGINYAPPILDGWNYGGWFTGFNGSNNITVRDPARSRFPEDPTYSWDEPYPAYTASLPNQDPTQLNGDFIQSYLPETDRFPMTQNWNVGIQYQMPWETRLEVNYVGSHGSRLNDVYLYSLNQLNPSYLSLGDTLLEDINDHPEIPKPYASFEGTVAQALRPFPQYYGVSTHRLASGYSNYNSMQLTATKRATTGLSFLAAYTFSKSMATADNAIGSSYYGGYGQDFYNRKADYSVTTFHVPHDLKVTWIWEMPIGPTGRWLRDGWVGKVIGGWTMSAIHRYRSGAPLAVYTGGYDSEALFNPGFRPDVVLPEDQQKLGGQPSDIDRLGGTPYLNPDAFAELPKSANNVPLKLGNAPRYLPNIRGFKRFGEDFSLMKRFGLPAREGANVEVRIDVTNLFNRIGIAGPETDVNDPQRFGRVFSKAGGPRVIQGGLRFSF